MNILITDRELMAYAEGSLSTEESRALERKAVETGQADLLLSVIIGQAAIEKELCDELWGEESPEYRLEAPMDYRQAAFIDLDCLKKSEKEKK